MLPNLSLCSKQGVPASDRKKLSNIQQLWLEACGNFPEHGFRPWATLTAKQKADSFYNIALMAEQSSGQAYVDPYTNSNLLDLFNANEHRDMKSIEHVYPRSQICGSSPHPAEDDPNGWVTVTQGANSRRGSHPLLLWESLDGQVPIFSLVKIEGETHYVPPVEHRARLARVWMYVLATYSGQKAFRPLSKAQRTNLNLIISYANVYPVSTIEKHMNREMHNKFGWSNPLICADSDPSVWYENVEWRRLLINL